LIFKKYSLPEMCPDFSRKSGHFYPEGQLHLDSQNLLQMKLIAVGQGGAQQIRFTWLVSQRFFSDFKLHRKSRDKTGKFYFMIMACPLVIVGWKW